MADTEKTKGKRVTFEWSKEEDEALTSIATREPFATLGSSRRAIMRYILLLYAKTGEEERDPVTKADIKRLESLMTGVAMVAKVGKNADGSEPAKRGPKPAGPSAEDREEEGARICEILGGVASGKSCSYKKYEVTATGRPVDYEVTEPLATLSEATITKQFDPSKEAYDKAVSEWKE